MFDTVNKILEETNQIFVDRESAARLVWTALLSGEHLFFLGRPGIAKSMLLEDAARRIDGADLFLKQVFKSTKPDEVFGPVSISALRQDQFRHNIDGYMPTAPFVFLDEVWKGPSALLNGLLRILNEREFVNGSERVPVPLRTLFTASNELPEGPELQALYDRILLRDVLEDVNDQDFRILLAMEPSLDDPPEAGVTLEDLDELRKLTRMTEIPDTVLDQLTELRMSLRAEGIEHAPRRWIKGLKAVRAQARLAGRDEASVEDLSVYQYILWDSEDQRRTVRRTVISQVNPLSAKVLEVVDDVIQIKQDLRELKARGADADETITEYQHKLREAKRDLNDIARGGNELAAADARRGLSEVNDGLRTLAVDFLDVSPDIFL
jgi:MoxR-like ATPase